MGQVCRNLAVCCASPSSHCTGGTCGVSGWAANRTALLRCTASWHATHMVTPYVAACMALSAPTLHGASSLCSKAASNGAVPYGAVVPNITCASCHMTSPWEIRAGPGSSPPHPPTTMVCVGTKIMSQTRCVDHTHLVTLAIHICTSKSFCQVWVRGRRCSTPTCERARRQHSEKHVVETASKVREEKCFMNE